MGYNATERNAWGGISDETYYDAAKGLPERFDGYRRLWRVPGFLPERLQNVLHGGEPELPEKAEIRRAPLLDAAKQ
jgi:hypothetical protein